MTNFNVRCFLSLLLMFIDFAVDRTTTKFYPRRLITGCHNAEPAAGGMFLTII